MINSLYFNNVKQNIESLFYTLTKEGNLKKKKKKSGEGTFCTLLLKWFFNSLNAGYQLNLSW